MSLMKFRIIDILIFTILAIILDSVIGVYGLFGIRLFVSIGIPIVLLLYIRWGKYALITNVVLVIAHFIIHYVNIYVMIAHSFGLLSLSLALLLVKWRKLSKRNIDVQYIFIYFGLLYLTMMLVEWIFLGLFNQDIKLTGHLLNHSLNIFLSICLLYMMSRQKDLIVNMNKFLQDNVEGD